MKKRQSTVQFTDKAFLLISFLTLVSVCLPCPALTQDSAMDTISFSRLLVRFEGEMEIGIAPEEYRIFIIERLRERGYNVKGAESILFDQDRSDEARFILGATLTELECSHMKQGVLRGVCDIAVEWQLFDRARDAVVYKVLTRSSHSVERKVAPEKVVKILVLGTLDSLMKRPRFINAQKNDAPVSNGDAEVFEPAEFKRCERTAIQLPKHIETVQNASVLITSGKGGGSGFFISRDGLIITAAHVVAHRKEVDIRLNDGTESTAQVLRVNKAKDVALLKANISPSECLELQTTGAVTGSHLYAVGTPAAEELAFSVSMGIVSGVRAIDDVTFVQTDASLSPGNSGGPMVDEQGAVIAVVSWKITRQGYEGLSFGVATSSVIDALNIQPGNHTTVQAESQNRAAATTPAENLPFVDIPDLTRAQIHQQIQAQKQREWAEKERRRAEVQARAEDKYQQEVVEWEKKVAPLKARRRPYLLWGSMLEIVGVSSLITAAVLKSKSNTAAENADNYYYWWQRETDASSIQEYEEGYLAQAKRRDRLNGAAIGLAAGGAVAAIAGLIVIGAAPNLPSKPKRNASSGLKVSPIAGPTTLGIMGTF